MKKRESIFNLPNLFTTIRLFLTFFVVKAILQKDTALFITLFLIAAATEKIDGFIAKSFKRETEFGKNYDPVADTIFLAGVYISLALVFPLVSVYLVFLGIATGIRILGHIIFSIKSGKLVFYTPPRRRVIMSIPLEFFSKYSTGLLWVAALLLFLEVPYSWIFIWFIIAIKFIGGFEFIKVGLAAKKQKNL